MSVGAWLLAAALVGEVLGWVLLEGDAARALLVTLLLGPFLLAAAWRVLRNRPVTFPRLRPGHVGVLVVWAGIGVAALVIAMLSLNAPYYIAADLYHWFVEVLLVALLTAYVFGRGSASDAAWITAVTGLIVGLVCVATFVLGSLQLTKGGTHFVANLGVARLIVGRGTPQLMFLIVTAALWWHRSWDGRTNLALTLAWLLLAVAMAATLKRTLWLSFPVAALWVILPRRWLLAGLLGMAPVLVLAGCVYAAMPESINQLAQRAADALTYNPSFTVEETLARREAQLQSVWPYIVDQPAGHGLGASVFAFWTRGQTYDDVHYIHNFYAYYGLQLGVGLLLLTMLSAGWLGWTWLNQPGQKGDWGFATRAALGCLVALAINGMSLVATHTVFAGFALGLGLAGAAKLRTFDIRHSRSDIQP
ncbi:MAG: O-antigen ligase family protein [Phycisphaeraceae bacterium]|nr:O-antigen ligase family protein [Phycisphaeraceae bacterium]